MHLVLGQILALLTAACWAHNSIVYSEAGKKVGSRTVTHIRLWIALPAMLVVHVIVLGRLFPAGYQLSAYLYLLSSGFFGLCIADLLIFRAFVDLGPRETMVIMTLSPIFAALFSWLVLGEILSPLHILGIGATVAGVIWVILEEEARSRENKNPETCRKRAGALFALGGAFTQALGLMLAKAGLISGLHPVSGNLLRLTAGLIGLIFFALIRGTFVRDFAAMKDRRALGLITSGALIGPVLGIVLSLYALSWAPVGIVTALMQTSPILLLPLDYFLFRKNLTPGAVAGTLIAVGGTILLFSL